jgi:cysteine synthase
MCAKPLAIITAGVSVASSAPYPAATESPITSSDNRSPPNSEPCTPSTCNGVSDAGPIIRRASFCLELDQTEQAAADQAEPTAPVDSGRCQSACCALAAHVASGHGQSSPHARQGTLPLERRVGPVDYVDSLVELFGNTRWCACTVSLDGAQPTVLAKVEYFNPGGSVKDRIAERMVEAAEKEGLIREGGTIVEPTSGNTGVGLAIVAQAKGYRCVFVCPDKVSVDKINVMKAYGAEVVVCPTAVPPEHPNSYYNTSDRLVREIEGSWKPNQYANPHNPRSHYETTGPEIWRQTEGRITHFVTGVGTGGTISGTGRYLKEVSEGRVQVIGADPTGSVYSGGTGRPYLVEGVGEDFWPEAYDPSIPDRIIEVSDKVSFLTTRRLAREEALRSAVQVGWRLRPPYGWRRRWTTRKPSSWCCCPTAAAAIWARCSTTPG